MEYRENEELLKKIEQLFISINERHEFQRINGFNDINNIGVISESKILTEQEWLDTIQGWLDWAGVIPVYGDAVDAVNAIIYFIRAGISGKFMPNGLNGLMSCIGIIPVVGSAMSIPAKAAFKVIPIKQASNIIETLAKKSGDDAANLFYKYAPKDSMNKLGSIINKNQDRLIGFFKGLLKLLKKIPLIGSFLKIAEPLIKRIVRFLIGIGEKVAEKSAEKSVKSSIQLGVKSIPSNALSRGGRLLFKPTSSALLGKVKLNLPFIKRIGVQNSSKIWYGAQDQFMSYLKKGGWKQMKKGESGAILRHTIKNLKTPKLAGETIEQYIKRVGENKFWRECTNLSIVNNNKLFTDFVNSPSNLSNFKTFMSKNFPKINPKELIPGGDYFSLWTFGVKSAQKVVKSNNKPSEDDYQYNIDRDREQKKLDKRKEKTGSHIGKKRNA